MNALPLNRLWCRAVLARLKACGVRDVVLCHGGRSAAFAMEASHTEGLRTFLRIDERGAAFLALGMARAGGRPVAIATTSGSAVANAVPALGEAWTGGGALILVSCDRPRSARAQGAPQTLAHLPLTKSVVAAQGEMREPAAEAGAFADLTERVDRLLRIACRGNQPVHLNLPLNGEIASVQPDDPSVATDLLPPLLDRPLSYAARRPEGRRVVDAWIQATGVGAGHRGVIAIGAHAEVDADAVADLAQRTGFPPIVDAGSGLRARLDGCLTLFDIAIFHPLVAAAPPQIVLHAGKPMTSPFLERWLNAPGAARFALDHVRERGLGRSVPRPAAAPAALAHLAARLGSGDTAWSEQIVAIDRAANDRVPDVVNASGWNEATATYHALRLPGFDRIFLASSLAVRMGNLWVAAGQDRKVDVNRGLNGIDGTLSAFFGTLSANGERGLLVVGDQAFLHDLPGLERLDRPVRGVILLIDNSGPGLFDLAVWNAAPDIRAALHRATAMDVPCVAAAFGLGYVAASDPEQLKAGIAAAPDDAMTIVHARVPGTGLDRAVDALARGLLGVGQ